MTTVECTSNTHIVVYVCTYSELIHLHMLENDDGLMMCMNLNEGGNVECMEYTYMRENSLLFFFFIWVKLRRQTLAYFASFVNIFFYFLDLFCIYFIYLYLPVRHN